MASEQSGTIELWVFGSGWGVPFVTGAPFPLKLETWLRMTGLRYVAKVENDASKGPKGKSPWIVDGDVRMGDSELVIAYLKQKYGVDPDAHLSPEERALSVAWHRTFEEHYHQAFEHQLFFGVGGDARKKEMLAMLPAPLRPIVGWLFPRQLAKQLHARGLGRHDEATIVAMGKADLDAASVFLGKKRFFLGDEPSSLDACVFGFLGVSVYVEGDNPLFRHAASLENLRAYCERMRERFFPETLAPRPGKRSGAEKPAESIEEASS